MPTTPRVFISYSHDSADHQASVLELAQQLQRDGIAAELDQFHFSTSWMTTKAVGVGIVMPKEPGHARD